MARRLVLVKHALPVPDPSVPAAQWRLGSDGEAQAAGLAHTLREFEPYALFASTEDKALRTALIICNDAVADDRLREIHRPVLAWMGKDDHSRFNRRLFDDPDTAVVGDESARAAFARFDEAIGEVSAAAEPHNVVVVAHGTVIALFVAAHNEDVDAFALWEELQCGQFVVVSLPDYHRV